MTAIPLASASAEARSSLVTGERLVNLYAEANPEGARAPFSLYRTPGLRLTKSINANIGRGMIAMEDENRLLTVHDTTLIAVDVNLNPTLISGAISGADDLIIARNMRSPDPQIVFVGEAGIKMLEGTTLTTISDGDLPSGIVSVDFLNSFMIYAHPDGRMFSSAANDASAIDPLDFATAESSPDGLVRAKVFRNELFAFGVSSTEPWRYDPSSAAFPFIAVPGAAIPVGLINKHAICDHAGQMVWVDHTCVVRRLKDGYGAERISNLATERAIQQADPASIKVFAYSDQGHQFFVVRAPTFTKVYDASTNLWHDRKSYRRNCWQAKHYAFFADKHLVSRDIAGDLLEMRSDVYDEDGEHQVIEFTLPPVEDFPNGGITHQLTFDIECGTGAAATAPAEDYEPELMLELSVDGGKTWKPGRKASLGPRGRRRKQVQFMRCGEFGRQGLQIRGSCSAAVSIALTGADFRGSRRAA